MEIDENGYLTREEMMDLISSLSDSDFQRLRNISKKYTWINGWDPNDLLAEAFKRSLRVDGEVKKRRRCKRGKCKFEYFASAMKSIANSEYNKQKELLSGISVDDLSDSIAGADNATTMDEKIDHKNMCDEINDLFADDFDAQMIIEGMFEGKRGKELRELTDLPDKDYQSKRRYIRRKIDQHFGTGYFDVDK